MKDSLRKAARAVAPRAALAAYQRLRVSREARRLVTLRERGGAAEEWIDKLLGSYFFRPLQKRSEILRLVERVESLRPEAVCEVGAAKGGTAFLFAHAAAPGATIISVDLAFGAARREAIGGFARRGQRVVCVEGDSHSAGTLEAVRASLLGRPLDLLYLDGDHSYEGVAADFRLYGPLVRRGGLVVFHDIVPDYRTRFGVETSSETGGVPRFWGEIKSAFTGVEEIVEDEGQDGFGIGVLCWPGAGREDFLCV